MILFQIQILRAVAALMVVWHHARHEVGQLAWRGADAALDPGTLLPWWGGVDLFFVISGFVIVHASTRVSGISGGRVRFLGHRVARVVPLYWLVSLAVLVLALARPESFGDAATLVHEPGTLLATFLFWPAARPDGTVQPLYGLGWTLNYEAFFYGLFALGLGFGRRGAVAWLALSLLLLVAAGAFLPGLPLPVRFWANPIVLEFAFGAGLALAHREGFRPSATLRFGLAVSGLIGLAVASRLLVGDGAADGFLRPLLVGVPAALLVAAALGAERDAADMATLPAPVRVLARLGDASYALYLIHPFALRLVRETLQRLGLASTPPIGGSLVLMVAGSILAALLVHRFIERPLTRSARTVLDRMSA